MLGLSERGKVCLIGVDYDRRCHPHVVADLQLGIPIRHEVADSVIVSSFLYIVADPQGVLRETRRVLKPNGLLLLTAPLVFPHTPEPTDHWRFTEESLQVLLRQAGFHDIAIVPVGGRWIAAAFLVSPFLRPRWFVAPIVDWFALRLDGWTERKFPRLARCPIGYVAKARARP